VPRKRRDLVAFAALLYQMLTGVAPFGDDERDDARRRPRSLRTLRREVPRRLARPVMRGLDRSAARRRLDLGRLLNALEQELIRLESRDVWSGRPHRWRITVGIVVAAGAVLATLTWWTAEVRRLRPVTESSTVEQPMPPTPAPDPVIRPAEPRAPSAEPDQPVQRKAVPMPLRAVEPPSPPSRVPPVPTVAPPPVRPQPPQASGSADAAPDQPVQREPVLVPLRAVEPPSPPSRVPPVPTVASPPVRPQPPRPAEGVAPAERDAERDPTAIIDWLLRNR
jgi:hypothetical protein